MSRAALDGEAQATERLADELRERGVDEARLAFVLGSGLGAFAERLEDPLRIPYAELENMPQSAVPGHAGELWLGSLEGERVVVQRGRVHLYEGWSVGEVTRCVRALASLGVGELVLTNAAGGIEPDWPVPTLMRVTDHIDLQGRARLARRHARRGRVYDEELGELLASAATEAGVELESGVYAGLPGPSYETPAEIRMLRWAGASAVGMSTVQEASTARAEGMRVAAVSTITNPAAGISPVPLAHDEVVEAGQVVAERFCSLLTAFVAARR